MPTLPNSNRFPMGTLVQSSSHNSEVHLCFFVASTLAAALSRAEAFSSRHSWNRRISRLLDTLLSYLHWAHLRELFFTSAAFRSTSSECAANDSKASVKKFCTSSDNMKSVCSFSLRMVSAICCNCNENPTSSFSAGVRRNSEM